MHIKKLPKYIIRTLLILILAALLATYDFFFLRPERLKQQAPAEELKILSRAPEGEELPISTEGITVMFNQPMVPLTTLDRGRDEKIHLEIEPKIEGKFFWLGTHGFIFRPDKPFDPATRYRVSMGEEISSIHGGRLTQTESWEFSTVTPRVINWSQGPHLLPQKPAFFVQFNLAMQKEEVEKNLQISDKKTGQLVSPRKWIWTEDDHMLVVLLDSSLPWNSDLEVKIPAGLHGRMGELGSREEKKFGFSTPSDRFSVDKVTMAYGEDQLKPGVEFLANTSQAVCFHFSQAIDKKSFEKSFKILKPDKTNHQSPPYFYAMNGESFELVNDNGTTWLMTGYRQGCVSFLDDTNTRYEFSVDVNSIKSISGAQPEGKPLTYIVRTDKASPVIASLLSKNILSPQETLTIPYSATHIAKATIRLYRIDYDSYSEDVKSDEAQPAGRWDKKGNNFVYKEPPTSEPLGAGNLVLPLDEARMAIDTNRMPPVGEKEFLLEAQEDKEVSFSVNLSEISDFSSEPRAPEPGAYLIEAIGQSSLKNHPSPRPVYSIVQITTVALSVKREVDHVLVWATDIQSGEPLEKLPLKVTLFESDKKMLKEISGSTNKQGVAVFDGIWVDEEDWGTNLCVEVTDTKKLIRSCQSDHGVGDPYRDRLRKGPHFFAYVYTDRPIYRPGQKVHFSSFVREVKEGRYLMPDSSRTFDVVVEDAAGETIFEKKGVKLLPGGIIENSFDLSTSDDIPRGAYAVTIKTKDQTFARKFHVTSYRKPSFKVEMTSEKPEVVNGNDLQVKVKGTYYFGAPLRKAKASWSIMTSTYFFSPDGYSDFSFIDDDLLRQKTSEEGEAFYFTDYEYEVVEEYPGTEDSSKWDDPRGEEALRQPSSLFKSPDGKQVKRIRNELDQDGILEIRYKPDIKKYPISQLLTVEANVTDPSQQEVAAAGDVIVHKGEFYIGGKTDRWVYGKGEKAHLDVVTLDTKGKASGGRSFTAELIRREYKFIERQNAQGYWEYIFDHQDSSIQKLKGKTDPQGKARLDVVIPQAGTYRLILRSIDSKENNLQSAVSFYASGEGYVPWKVNEPQTLELVADKSSYKVGETARVLVKSLMPVSKALVTLERGRVLEYRVVKLGTENSSSNAGLIEIPITEGTIPNIFVSVVAHAGREGERAPLLFSGETELVVEPESKRLQVQMTADREGTVSPGEGDKPPIYRPGEEVTLKIKTTDGGGKPQPAYVMLSVADESVLNLLAYKLPDLVKKFFYKRANSVTTSSSLISLKAGDGGVNESKKRKNLHDTAHFTAAVKTNEKGEASVTFKLPDDLTTWVAEALAITPSKTVREFELERKKILDKTSAGQKELGINLALTDNTLVGGGRTKLMTTLPVLIRPAFPRFAVWGDQIRGKVILNNQNPSDVSGTIRVHVSKEERPQGGPFEIPFSLKGESEKSFPVNVQVASGKEGLVIQAEAFASDKKTVLDAFEIRLPVLDRYPSEVVATAGMTESEAFEQIDLPPEVEKGAGGLHLSLKASLALATTERLKELIYYPWGCSEQKSASLLALLMTRDLSSRLGEKYFDAVAPLTDKEKEEANNFEQKLELVDQKIKKILGELKAQYQNHDGGMKYWPGMQDSDFFASAQTYWAMTLAGELSYSVDAGAKANLREFLRSRLLSLSQDETSLESLAFGMWALSRDMLTSEASLKEVQDFLYRNLNRLSTTGLSYFLMSLSLAHPAQVLEWNEKLKSHLISLAQQEPRHTSWPASHFFWSSAEKNTALAGLALLETDQQNPFLFRAMTFLLNRKKTGVSQNTQDNLYVSYLAHQYAKAFGESDTHFVSHVDLGGKFSLEKEFTKTTVLDVATQQIPMKELKSLILPADLKIRKEGKGTLYYDAVLKYYLPPDKAPPREEGLIISRDYYSLDDAKEEKPLSEFEVGENYKGHITLIVPQEMNYILIQDLLPSGFEPIDMTLATTSRVAYSEATASTDSVQVKRGTFVYDDVVTPVDFWSDLFFDHQEIRDDSIVWSSIHLYPGVYHIRYPVRTTTEGHYMQSGAHAFEFYEPEIFARGKSRMIEIISSK